MADNNHVDAQPSVAGLVGGILEDTQKLVRQEVALARSEVAEACAKAKTGLELLSSALLVCGVGGVLLGFMGVTNRRRSPAGRTRIRSQPARFAQPFERTKSLPRRICS
jgi:hypothetical protein